MNCNECDYAADYIDDSEVDKKQCDITDEVHEAEFACNCEAQRRMYDKRNRLIMEYETIKDKATLSSTCIICGKTVDGEYGSTKVCFMCRHAIQFITDKRDILESIVACYEHGLEEESPEVDEEAT